MLLRTSVTHPLRIDTVSCAPHAQGSIGITFCPGKCGPSLYGAHWARDLEADLDAVLAWRASVVLTLIEDHEFAALRVAGLGDGVRRRGADWQHLPIKDLSVPDRSFEGSWMASGALALAALTRGERVLVHCRGGLGRAGVVACMLLIEAGESPAKALETIRAARHGTVETAAQERYVLAYRPRLPRDTHGLV